MMVNRRQDVKELAGERKKQLLACKVLYQFIWDLNEVIVMTERHPPAYTQSLLV